MLVILDTNHIFDDPFLTRPSLRALLAHRLVGQFDVGLAAVVVDEAVRQYEKHLAQRPARAHEQLGRSGEISPAPGDDPVWLERYRERFIDRLAELGILLLDEPPTEDIDRWRRDARKPFKNDAVKKDGDARIWATALEAAGVQHVILVSANRKDFGSDPQTLAPELLGDLVARGLRADRVLLRPSVVSVLGHLGAPYVDKAHAADLLERGKGKRALLELAERAATDRLLDDDSAALLPLDVELDAECAYVSDFIADGLEVNAAYRISDDEIAVEVAVLGEVTIDVLVFKADAYGLQDESPIEIHDLDFNESYAEGQACLELEVILETTVDEARKISETSFIGARPPA